MSLLHVGGTTVDTEPELSAVCVALAWNMAHRYMSDYATALSMQDWSESIPDDLSGLDDGSAS